MSGRDILVELSALSAYAARSHELAGEVQAIAAGRLAAHAAVPADLLGDLGEETGLHRALGGHLAALHDHVHSLAGSVSGLGTAVAGARTDYELDEQDQADQFRRLHD